MKEGLVFMTAMLVFINCLLASLHFWFRGMS